MNQRISTVVGYGLCFLIVFPPLAFGSVYPWAYSILELVAFSLLLLWLIANRPANGDPRPQPIRLLPPFRIPFAIFIGLVLFQMVPLPPVMIRLLSPQTYALYCETLDGYGNSTGGQEAGVRSQNTAIARLGFDDPDVWEIKDLADGKETGESIFKQSRSNDLFRNWRSLSVYPHATKVELLKIMAYAAAFVLIVGWVDSRSKLLRLLYLLVIMGFSVSLIAMAQRFLGVQKIYGFWQPMFRTDQSFFGPYVNPNHFAGYMVLLIPIAVALLIRQMGRMTRDSQNEWKDWSRRLYARDFRLALAIFLAMALMVCGVFLSLSRGGILAFTGSMIFLIMLLSNTCGWRSVLGVGLLIGLVVLLFDFWLGFVPFQNEVEALTNLFRDPNVQGRMTLWSDGWGMLRDFPLFGTGLGTFAHVYPKYKTLYGQATVVYPESDVLPLLVETGLVGFGVLAWLFASFFRAFWIRWKGHGSYVAHINPRVMAGLAAGLVALMLHSVGDFNLHIPANALQFVMVMALALAVKQERNDMEVQSGFG